ncbi:MAG: hypothetical protein AMJ81_02360 [Phycisphaerae bacterium SM23_33]|nr:MAG: hypothetical protein AMJ81_02360 [Phycisphaerae bacterium SM23_33]
MAALLMAAFDGCGRQEKPAQTSRVLKWRRNVPAGSNVSGADVGVVELPVSTDRSFDDVLRGEHLPLFSQPMHLSRHVRKGDLVRGADLLPGPASRPAPGSPQAGDVSNWRHLPVGEPGQMEAAGKHPAYVTTTREAPAEGPESLASEAPGPGGPMDLATRPLIQASMRILGEDVPDVFVPPGSRRIYGFRQELPEGYSDNLAYLSAAGMAAAETFYKTRLPEEGYRLVGRGATLRRDGGVSLAFVKGGKHHYFVNLHPVDKGKQVKIVLMIGRPAGEQKDTGRQ